MAFWFYIFLDKVVFAFPNRTSKLCTITITCASLRSRYCFGGVFLILVDEFCLCGVYRASIWVKINYATTNNHPLPATTSHNHPPPPTTTHNHPPPPTTTHNHLQPPTTTYSHPRPSTTTHSHPQPPTTIHHHPSPTRLVLKKDKCLSGLLLNLEPRPWSWTLDPEKPGPRKTCTLKNLNPEQSGP